MSISNEATNIKDKDCSGCEKSKSISEFTSQHEDKQNRLNRLDKKLNVDKQVDSLNNILVETENYEIANIENELVNEEALLLELDFEELLLPELDYENMLLPELDHKEMLPSELDQDEMLSLELDKKFYKQLCNKNLVNLALHTYQQVYYWAHKSSRKLYVTDVANHVKFAINFLEQKELVDAGYKVIHFLENNFVHSLGFATPFLCKIKDYISEIIIDSTFKTNQEQFELFVVNANCSGYGVPLAYLYVDTYSALEEILSDPNNIVHTRVDAQDTNLEFMFIDPSWLSVEIQSKICPKESIKELSEIITKHILLYSLIPTNKNPFLTSNKIRYQSVWEIYQFCYNKGLATYPKAVPIARTTMITESHWRVLKYNYKYNLNRPRLDHLTYIIAKELVLDMENT
ncbi:33838_t:CDS:2 [Gigaspora margarita]|uniref:33838_t:CDS:1 n=1 Tax=Gigaspora margarita TaxID=4874 RepID=A0ABN7V004_GIGMA|nr:33838_t:CDS:2 [Gigaspora margarita]